MTKEKRHSARAVVIVTLEIDVGSNWGGYCSTSQIYKQATAEAEGAVYSLLEKSDYRQRIRIQGIPKVTCIVTEREDV